MPHGWIRWMMTLASFGTANAYERMKPEACPPPARLEHSHVLEIDSMHTPTHLIHQGEFGSCFAMAAKNLLESYQPGLLVSVTGLLGANRHGNLLKSKSGVIYDALQAVRRNSNEVLLDKYDPRTSTWDYDRVIPSMGGLQEQIDLEDQEAALAQISKLGGSISWKDCQEDPSTCLYRALIAGPLMRRAKIRPFDIHVVAYDYPEESGDWDHEMALMTERMTQAVRGVLGQGRAVGLASAFHASAIFGTRKSCCVGGDGEKLFCRDEFKILDSLERDQTRDNWFINPDLDISSFLVYVAPCASDGCNPHIQGPKPIEQAIAVGDVAYLEQQLSAGLDPNGVTEYPQKNRLLAAAVASYQPDVVKLLLDRGASITDATDFLGTSPLARAIDSGSIPMVALLLEHGADIRAISLSDVKGRAMTRYLKERGAQ